MIWQMNEVSCSPHFAMGDVMVIKFNGKKFQAIQNGKVIAESTSKYYLKSKLAKLDVATEPTAEDNPALKFPINKRFEFAKRLVSMVGEGKTASAIIVGEGGLGKSYSVTKALREIGLKDISGVDFEEGTTFSPKNVFKVIKGFSTPKALYRTLYENRDSVVVFDDCDSVLKHDDAISLLKGALDSYDRRIISWNTDRADEDLPQSFQFNGGVVFISNRSMDKIDQALRSRSMCVDLTMTIDQKIERMETIIKSSEFLPEIKVTFKKEALNLIKSLKDKVKEVSLRSLITVSRIRADGSKQWKDLATYTLMA